MSDTLVAALEMKLKLEALAHLGAVRLSVDPGSGDIRIDREDGLVTVMSHDLVSAVNASWCQAHSTVRRG